MSKGILLGTFTGDGNFVHQVDSYVALRYSIFLRGNFDQGALTILGGDGTNFEAVMITDPADGSNHSPISISTNAGHYTFDTLCAFLKFVMAGSASPNLELTLFPEPRH